MKEVIALIIFLGITGIALRWLVTKKIDNKAALILLGFAIVSGIAITNHDVIKKLKWVGLEVETEKAKKDINTFANSKLEEINTEINKQKESINHLILDANNTRGKLEEQKQALSEMIKKAEVLQNRVVKTEQKQQETNETMSDLKSDINNVKQGLDNLANKVEKKEMTKETAQETLKSVADILVEAEVIHLRDKVDVIKKPSNETPR